MSLILSGTDGLSDVDGSAATPAIRGTDTNTGIFFPAADTIAFSEGGVESMRINSTGNVGIGTVSPASLLTLSVAPAVVDGTKGVRISNTGGGIVMLENGSSNDSYVGTLSASDFCFRTNNTERARITSGGNLLVGTTSAGVSNSLSTTIETSGANTSRITVNHSSIAGSSNGSYFMQFGYGGVLSGGITQASTTTVGFYTGPSDRRLKNNIEDLDSSGEFIDALRPRKWTWIKSGEADSGFVADELQTVISCCVNGEADAVDEDGKPVYQMVDASPPEMIANIVAELKAIRKREKEQQALITSLTSRITELEAT